MAGYNSAGGGRTPARPPPVSKKAATASGGKQQSILGFFTKTASPATSSPQPRPKPDSTNNASSPCLQETTRSNSMIRKQRPSSKMTPVPSSDAIDPASSQENVPQGSAKLVGDSLPSPLTPAEIPLKQGTGSKMTIASSSPTRKVRLFLCLSYQHNFSYLKHYRPRPSAVLVASGSRPQNFWGRNPLIARVSGCSILSLLRHMTPRSPSRIS